MKRPMVDIGLCTLCMGCVELCPDVFELNDMDQIAVIEMEAYPQKEVSEAIKYCPEDAIAWEA